jgi:AraC-like DNA-binding protein
MQSLPVEQLIRLLRSQVVPWALAGARSTFFVARARASSLVLPPGVKISRRKLAGRRRIVKNNRQHANKRYYTAVWPEDNLQELITPKIVCVISGSVDYLIGDYCLHGEPETFFLIPPGVPHQRMGPFSRVEESRAGTCVLLHANALPYSVIFWYSRSVGGSHINEAADNYVIPSMTAAQTLQLMVSEAEEDGVHYEQMARGFMGAFFAAVANEIEAGDYVHPGPSERIVDLSVDAGFADQVQEYVNAHCHRRLYLDEVAAHFYMSRSQFARRMHAEAGMPFSELLTRVRIERACKLLRETDYTVSSISKIFKFRSATYFQSLFRRRMGCTATEYRKKTDAKN